MCTLCYLLSVHRYSLLVVAFAANSVKFLIMNPHIVLQETFQWSGTTSKRKGQKWGIEKTSFCRRNGDNSGENSNEKVKIKDSKLVDGPIDFEKLVPLSGKPKVHPNSASYIMMVPYLCKTLRQLSPLLSCLSHTQDSTFKLLNSSFKGCIYVLVP